MAFDKNLSQRNVPSRFSQGGLFRKTDFQLVRGDKALLYRHFPQDRYAAGFIGLRIIHVLTFREIIRKPLFRSHYSRLYEALQEGGESTSKVILLVWPILLRIIMSEISSVAASVTASSQAVNLQGAAMRLLDKALQVQTEAMEEILASMGLGQNIDIQA